MRRRVFFLIGACALLSTGCFRHYRDTTLYQCSGRQKAIVSVLPVLNHADIDAPWDLGNELTDEIRNRVYASPRIYLLREGGSEALAEKLNVADLSKLKQVSTEALAPAQFVVVAELIEQTQSPYGLKKAREEHPFQEETGSTLELSMRVRVLDVREKTPKVVLQEVLTQTHDVARAYMKCDYQKTPWGTNAFHSTPMGLAHNRLVRELVSRVESYIEAAH